MEHVVILSLPRHQGLRSPYDVGSDAPGTAIATGSLTSWLRTSPALPAEPAVEFGLRPGRAEEMMEVCRGPAVGSAPRADRSPRMPEMTPLVALTVVLLGQGQAPKPPDRPDAAPSGIAVVAAIESALTDAIARAEPSVVAIHRTKGRNPRETLAVRGREPSPRPDQRDLDRVPASAGGRGLHLVRLRVRCGRRRRGARSSRRFTSSRGRLRLIVKATDRQSSTPR